MERFRDVLDRCWLSNNGPFVQEFEARIAQYLGVRNCIAVSNATIGVQLAIHGLGLSGEVIVPSFTFPATVHALAWQGLRPVFCDIDPATHNLDPAAVERLIGPETTGILGVHVWGNPCAIDALATIAKKHRISLLYDAAHAFGCAHDDRMIGNFGDAEVFSFHATKFVNAGEGGAITTNDDDLAARLRRLRNFGIENEQVQGIGINGKMSEFSAAMGLTSLESCDEFIARNKANYAAYERALASVRGIELFSIPARDRRNQQYVVAQVDEREAGISRDGVMVAIHKENVLAKRYFFPGCHRIEPYVSSPDARWAHLPHTERISERLLQLPTGTAVSQTDIARIGDLLMHLTARARKAA
ncbi:MAG TPA: DegT/DnrJ/EryC1/StrS family aminotransferase [Lacipirellulaceae bacterium]|nr:DegT/DnrJ/EryC1/StrS family aminotransferase [Lacipirellulaceae bacterium]